MKYSEFKQSILNLPVFRSADFITFEKDKNAFLNQLQRWEKKDLIIKLKRGIYILNQADRKIEPSRQFIANQLYAPSYVSLEYALNLYGFIPERVITVTSVTTKKTANFKNKLGNFTYQHLKPECFRGMKTVKDYNDLEYFIAEPEKAIVDFLYLNLDHFRTLDVDIFEDSYRFQNVEKLSKKKIMQFASLFSNRKLIKIVKLFFDFVKKGKDNV